MKTNDIKNSGFWKIGVLIAFFLSYILSRFAFFELHGMKSWPNTLAVVGIIVLTIWIFTNNQRLSILTVIGYIGGFALAMLFNRDGVDPGGGRINNGWIIWGSAFIITIMTGIVWDMLSKK